MLPVWGTKHWKFTLLDTVFTGRLTVLTIINFVALSISVKRRFIKVKVHWKFSIFKLIYKISISICFQLKGLWVLIRREALVLRMKAMSKFPKPEELRRAGPVSLLLSVILNFFCMISRQIGMLFLLFMCRRYAINIYLNVYVSWLKKIKFTARNP